MDVTINSVLMFVVLLYVYPLKLFAEAVAGFFLGTNPQVLAAMEHAEVRGLFVIFGAGLLTAMLAFADLHLRAWSRREALGLDEVVSSDLLVEAGNYVAVGGIAAVSVLVASSISVSGGACRAWCSSCPPS